MNQQAMDLMMQAPGRACRRSGCKELHIRLDLPPAKK